MTSQQPARATALRDAFRRTQAWGPISIPPTAGLTAGFVASLAVDRLLFDVLGTPVRQFVDAGAFALVAAPVWLGVQRPAVRQAHEVMTWLNGWETERWQKEMGRRLTVPPRATPAMLEHIPDTLGLRPLRVEMLAVRGELDEARERLELLPTDTPWLRFERAALGEWVAWWSHEPSVIPAMRAAAEELDDEERRLAARVMIAASEARRAAVSGGDAIAPLAAVRPRLGARPGRYAFGYRTGVVMTVLLISIVASIAVGLASAFIR